MLNLTEVVNRLTQEEVNEFFSKYRNLLACLNQTAKEVEERTTASAMINRSVREDLNFHMHDAMIQDDSFARNIAHDDFRATLRAAMANAFHKCLVNGSLTFACKATEEANQEYQLLKIAAGIEKAPPPPPKPLSAAEQLDAEIKDDWIRLPADKLKAKQNNNPRYRARLNELLETDQIKSQISQMHDGSKGL